MARLASDPLATATSAQGLVLAAGRPEPVAIFEQQIVAFFVDVAETLSVPKSIAAIYGILFASSWPLSFAEIHARLDLSKGSISQGLRSLREIGAIREVSTPGARAELFVADTEMRQIVAHFLESRVEQQLIVAGSRFKGVSAALEGYSLSEQRVLKQRMNKLESWHAKARALLPMVRAFLKLGV